MSSTSSGHKWGAEGCRGQEIPQGSPDRGPPGSRCSLLLQKTPKGSALSVRPLPCPLLPAEGAVSLPHYSRQTEPEGSTLFQRARGWRRPKGCSGRATICLP